MKLTRINNPDGTFYYINSKTGEKITTKEGSSADSSTFLSFMLIVFGFISLIGGIIGGISILKENSLLGTTLIISAILSAVILFALSKILSDINDIKSKLN